MTVSVCKINCKKKEFSGTKYLTEHYFPVYLLSLDINMINWTGC